MVESNSIKIECTNGESFSLALPEPSDIDSFYAFSMHKAGSTLMDKMLTDFCKAFSIPVVSPHAAAWQSGISTGMIGRGIANVLKSRGYAYLGFRHFLPHGLDINFELPKKVLLVRDPRDMLTSLYFSVRYSHSKPAVNGSESESMQARRNTISFQGIDEYAIENAGFYAKQYESYKSGLLSLPNTKVYRYEDVIFNKEYWLFSMLSFFNILNGLSEQKVASVIAETARRHDLRPSDENPSKHVRQVIPGNYKKHLSKATVQELNNTLGDFLSAFNYSM